MQRVRKPLVSSIHEVAKILSEKEAEDLLPLMKKFLNDKSILKSVSRDN
jgi:hypothetical protein